MATIPIQALIQAQANALYAQQGLQNGVAGGISNTVYPPQPYGQSYGQSYPVFENLNQRAARELHQWGQLMNNFIHFHDADGQLVFSLKKDGSIQKGPGYNSEEEAAMLFWRTVGEAFQMFKFSEMVK